MFNLTIVSQALAAGSLLIGTAAFAQTAQSPDTPPTLGQTLYDKGVILEGDYTGEAAANPAAASGQGSTYAGQVYFGLKLDFGKMFASQAANDDLHPFRHGRSPGQRLSRILYRQFDRTAGNLGHPETSHLAI